MAEGDDHAAPAPLRNQRCEACTAATPRVEGAELEALAGQLDPGWRIDGGSLRRDYRHPDFVRAFSHATAIALLAEAEGHHPDLEVGWGRVGVRLLTHAVGGLTRNDFILAAKIDAVGR